ncbi:hypothetical protein SUNI508_06357 [Seiridium unicorne]|uniref:Fucose-specific lectin n=1 Tax=Seiridium unicorne TaxID=138068 RepID=A0ABR2V154_9PEZI
MTSHGGPHHQDDQPGLEVDNYNSGLEVDTRYMSADSEGLQTVPYQDEPKYGHEQNAAPASTAGSYYASHDHVTPGLQTATLSNYDGQPYQNAPTEAPTTPRGSRKTIWIIVGAIAVLVIIGAVLGGVLGSRAAKSNSNDSSASSGNSTSNSTALDNIRSRSRLAVTGWRDGSNSRARLFYQGPDQKLRMSTYASNETWSDPIVLTDLEHAANDNTPLAAATSVEVDIAQVKVMYLDQNAILRGQGFQDASGQAQQGQRLVLNDYPITVDSTSRLASYWPFVVSQDADGAFRWIRYWGAGAEDWWTNDTLSVIGSSSAGMVVLPASAWYLDKGGFAYRRSDGKMRTYLTDTNNNATGTSWGTADLSEAIPDDTAIGGFAVARPNDTKNQTNTYLLYQDNSGTIQVVWQDDTSGWKGPSTYDAFDNADNGTDITCLTAAAWDASGHEVTSNQNMNRCYFQVGNKVREVYYDGSNWNDEGYLPIT